MKRKPAAKTATLEPTPCSPYPDDIITAARQAAATMTGNVVPLADYNGITLVRFDTPEAAERLADTSVLFMPINISSVPFFICSR